MSVDKAAKADEQKKQAALQALTLVKPGMNLGSAQAPPPTTSSARWAPR
jgi:hypothetical protein